MSARPLRARAAVAFAAGALALGVYTASVYPPASPRGYVEDHCMLDLTRQMASHDVAEHGQPQFESTQFMHPYGAPEVYMPWTIELSGLGAAFWAWDRDFPFYWAFFAFSLAACYLAVGFFAIRCGVRAVHAWLLAAVIAGLNVSRHYNAWYHSEFMLLHWGYLSLFLDAWIWRRFERERRWSWSLEAWRAWMGLMTLGTAGYFWGALLLEWALVRGFMLWGWWRGRERPTVEGSRRSLAAAGVLSAAWVGVCAWWFLPFFRQLLKLGMASRQIWWFGTFSQALRPLWFDGAWRALTRALGMADGLQPYTDVETVITSGWVVLLPALAVIVLLDLRRGLRRIAPFGALLAIALGYACLQPPALQKLIQSVVPFMAFFRVASRWGVLLPPILGVVIVLGWDTLLEAATKLRRARPAFFFLLLAAFGVSSVFEAAELAVPVTRMERLSPGMQSILEGLRTAPGSAVLDLPFCVAGANGTCTAEQCPQYPRSTAGLCWRGWHDKAVYGAYQSRMVDAQCSFYHRAPYLSWFGAWRDNRCFTGAEWTDFCAYLGAHPELSGILVYPDIWPAAGEPACWAEFERHLGAPHGRASFEIEWTRGERAPPMSRVAWFAARCQAR